MSSNDEMYEELLQLSGKAALLGSCGSVLGWDRETYMPTKGAEHRAEQLSLLAGMVHEMSTAPRLGELLDALRDCRFEGADAVVRQANVREMIRTWKRAVCLPGRLVSELARVTALAQQNWVEARSSGDFGVFQPWLEQIISLKREEASAVGIPSGGEAYDALLEEYEPGATSSEIAEVFSGLRQQIVPLLAAVGESSRRAPVEILHRDYDVSKQEQLARGAAELIGFDFAAGRLDTTAHPFCSGMGPGDCRLTTRYDGTFFSGSFFGTLHEAGHGLYEQGLPAAAFGTPAGTAVSLGIHESQSRLWENLVGRSRAFWEGFLPRAKQIFPESLGDVSLTDFHFAVNSVSPSFIRVEADEVTYNLHIMLRFDLERALIDGSLSVADLPVAWEDRFEHDFGIRPQTAADGCLQDIHWSAGLFGYFPTYALGNMYASQLFAAASQQLGDLHRQIREGEFQPLLTWLRTHIHQHGQVYSAAELIQRASGEPLSDKPLVRHLHERFSPLYGL